MYTCNVCVHMNCTHQTCASVKNYAAKINYKVIDQNIHTCNYSGNEKKVSRWYGLVDVMFCKTTPLLLWYKLRGFLSHRHNSVKRLLTQVQWQANAVMRLLCFVHVICFNNKTKVYLLLTIIDKFLKRNYACGRSSNLVSRRGSDWIISLGGS